LLANVELFNVKDFCSCSMVILGFKKTPVRLHYVDLTSSPRTPLLELLPNCSSSCPIC
jgi:hypothetical protein